MAKVIIDVENLQIAKEVAAWFCKIGEEGASIWLEAEGLPYIYTKGNPVHCEGSDEVLVFTKLGKVK